MQSQAEKEYLAKFAEMPVEEKRQHFVFALNFLRDIYAKRVAPEDGVIDGKDTVGDDCTMDGVEL